ncbi:hypothetical protein L226DRAFT_559352 [Lentinus tigrinus ALCF2SS1-7]|uniref:uncharacterized protein n=1 Tax=Lentinus tigrinus ALCF2SS1-7 TaxID=1328758 RepID=UPI0011660A22|nr:hypothetical protein L226DRAFT_559352 [Lentinus tigrinus ALCF2SS1-7]
MQLKGYEVWITCDGEPLPEYQTQVEGDDKTIACFIPSESGKEFVIHWRDNVKTTWLKYTFKLDGRSLSHAQASSAGVTGKVAGVLTGPDIEQPFQFADLRTSDDDALLNNMFSNADLGTIQVSVCRVHEHFTVVPFTPATFSAVGTVHERSKKAGAHNVTLGKGSRVADHPHRYLCHREPIDLSEGYVATFLFRYRPRALLQAQGVMPPSPVPMKEEPRTRRASDSVDDRPAKRPKTEPGTAIEDLGVIELSDDEDDLNVLQKRLLETQKRIERAKRKKAATRGTVKKEPGTSRRHPVGGSNDVIDLTED